MARIAQLTLEIKSHRANVQAAYDERRTLITDLADAGYSDLQIAEAANISRQLVERIRSGRPRQKRT